MTYVTYVLINTTVGEEENVRRALLKIKGTQVASTTSGAYDNVAVLEGESVDELIDLVIARIQTIPSVIRTETLVAKEVTTAFKPSEEKVTTAFKPSEEKVTTAFKPSEEKVTTAFKHGEYTLYTMDIKLRSGKVRSMHFFSKKLPKRGTPCDLPSGYSVEINKKSGMPYLKKAQ
jgi:DNA-binding Lrp family transcriptional regulator